MVLYYNTPQWTRMTIAIEYKLLRRTSLSIAEQRIAHLSWHDVGRANTQVYHFTVALYTNLPIYIVTQFHQI